MNFVPFSVRNGDESATGWQDVLIPGIPPHLWPSVEEWLRSAIRESRSAETLQRRLHIGSDGQYVDADRLLYLTGSEDERLDLLDATIQLLSSIAFSPGLQKPSIGGPSVKSRLLLLAKMLHESNSLYAVSLIDEETSLMGLTVRVDATAADAFQDQQARTTTASTYLATAWAETFKHRPDPAAGYSAAVKAVESVAVPTLLPTNPGATLGQAIAHLRQTMDRWTVGELDDKAQASSATLLAMLSTLWQNDHRHAAGPGQAPHVTTQGQAEAAVFFAVTLVQLFERGMVLPK